MERTLIQLEFFETYYYSNILSNIIADPFPYIRGIHEWYEDNEEATFLPAFPKFSRLHSFAAHIIHSLVWQQVSNSQIEQFAQDFSQDVWIDQALKFHGRK